jgi:competence protein ComEC
VTLDRLSKPLESTRVVLLWLLRAVQPMGTGIAGLRDHLLEERERWMLWLPVGVGVGVAFYFQLPAEPPLWPFAAAAAVAAVLALAGRRNTSILLAATIALAISAGMVLAKLRVDQVSAPLLARDLGPVSVEGRLLEAEPLPSGVRLTLDMLSFDRVTRRDLPQRIRVVSRQGVKDAEVGDRIKTTVQLSPPHAPAAPGAYDFQRDAWFLRLGGVGFTLSAPVVVQPAEHGSLITWFNRLRQHVTQRLIAINGGNGKDNGEGGMAAALLTGEQNAIPKDVLQAMRDSGLAHLLSVSGLHLAIVAAFLMALIRSLLAAIQPIALRYPIKKWAAGIALIGTLFYLLLAGQPVPAQRSFVMAAFVLLAIMADRAAISMRLVAWAALAVLALAPESMLGASFQMSFAAVIALVAAWEAVRPVARRWREERSQHWPFLVEWAGAYVGGVLLTTLVAGLASSGFGLYHFNRVALFSVAANLLAVPITGFWVMPWGMLALALMPFGLEGLALEPMRWGIAGIIYVAREVASWPGAAALVPALPAIALPLLAIGGLWLCLWQRRWRLLGLVPLLAVAVLAFTTRPPDILVSADARLFAVRDQGSGHLMLSAPRRDRLVGDTWMRRLGDDETADWPREGRSADGSLVCDQAGCILHRSGRTIALVERSEALSEDCASAQLVVSQVFARRICNTSKATLVDAIDLRQNGAYAIWIDQGGFELRSVRQDRGERPWTR